MNGDLQNFTLAFKFKFAVAINMANFFMYTEVKNIVN